MSERKSNDQNVSLPADNKQSKAMAPKGKEPESGPVRRRPAVLAPYLPRDIERKFDEVLERAERDFDDLLRLPSWMGRAGPLATMHMPSVDLEDKGAEFVLTVDMPGFKKDDDIDLNVTDDSVEIRAVKREAKEQQDKERNYIRRERTSEVYYRQISIPEGIRSDDAKANLNDGILQITLPKKAPKQKRKLNIT